jgi:Ni/Fe-hydrogenase subunit HybB-like protein
MSSKEAIGTKANTRGVVGFVWIALVLIGLGAFVMALGSDHPEKAWRAYIMNFLLWSGMAQGAVAFSAVTHVTKARWSKGLSELAESFSAFFPVSFVLFLILFFGKSEVFPWLHEELHGKAAWINLPFLFTRDGAGLVILYGLGFVYRRYAILLRSARMKAHGGAVGSNSPVNESLSALERLEAWTTLFASLYILLFTLVGSLIAFDLVMSMEPHWVSTLFGAYGFVKAFYMGLGGLIILAALVYRRHGVRSGLTPDNFHDVGKLFFAFGLLWADFYYVQLLVIWYGNLSEETSYVIRRTVFAPWNLIAWGVLLVCFLFPFLILLNKRIKTLPIPMILICGVVILGFWFEHLMLIGPAMSHGVKKLSIGVVDGLISLGFLGLMAISIRRLMNRLPEVVRRAPQEEE